jgi:hypothetical protein
MCGVVAGTLPALMATFPSLKSGTEIPWRLIIMMIIAIIFIGLTALLIAVRQVNNQILLIRLRRD